METRRRFIFSPDCANRDPFRGLPDDFPFGHSRFPPVPCEQYGVLSFKEPLGENAGQEERNVKMTASERRAWRNAMMFAFGDLVEISPAGSQKD